MPNLRRQAKFSGYLETDSTDTKRSSASLFSWESEKELQVLKCFIGKVTDTFCHASTNADANNRSVSV